MTCARRFLLALAQTGPAKAVSRLMTEDDLHELCEFNDTRNVDSDGEGGVRE
jgi:hypothetical protein